MLVALNHYSFMEEAPIAQITVANVSGKICFFSTLCTIHGCYTTSIQCSSPVQTRLPSNPFRRSAQQSTCTLNSTTRSLLLIRLECHSILLFTSDAKRFCHIL